MSGRADDDDDVFDIDDLRASLRGVRGGAGERTVLLGVALAVVAVCFALALVPHVLGAFGADAVDTGGGPTPDPDAPDGARERYQNYLTNIIFLFAPALIPVVAVSVAFAGAIRARGSRASRVGVVVAGTAIGAAVGYAVFVGVGHLAFVEANEGYVVGEFPVTIRYGSLAVNALALAGVSAVGSALAAVAATIVDPDPGNDHVPGIATDAASEGAGDAAGDAAGDESSTASADDGTSTGAAEQDRAGGERPARLDGSGGDAERGRDGGSTDSSGSGPASDYRETGPQRSSSEGTPTYDPKGRNWDGSGEDGD